MKKRAAASAFPDDPVDFDGEVRVKSAQHDVAKIVTAVGTQLPPSRYRAVTSIDGRVGMSFKFLGPMNDDDEERLWNEVRVPPGLLSPWSCHSPFDAEYVHDVSGTFLYMSKTLFDTFQTELRNATTERPLKYPEFNAWSDMMAYRPVVVHHLEEIQKAIQWLSVPRAGGNSAREKPVLAEISAHHPTTFLVRGFARSTMYQSEIYGVVRDPHSIPDDAAYLRYKLPRQGSLQRGDVVAESAIVSGPLPATPNADGVRPPVVHGGFVYALVERWDRPAKRVEYAPELLAVRLDHGLKVPHDSLRRSASVQLDRNQEESVNTQLTDAQLNLDFLRGRYLNEAHDAALPEHEGVNVLSVRYGPAPKEVALWLVLIRGRASIVAPSGEQFDHSPIGSVVFDLQGRILDMNRRALEMFASLSPGAGVDDLRDVRVRLLNQALRFYRDDFAAEDDNCLLAIADFMPDKHQQAIVRHKMLETIPLLRDADSDPTYSYDKILNDLRARDELLFLHLRPPGLRPNASDPFSERTYAVSIALHEVENETPNTKWMYRLGSISPIRLGAQSDTNARRKNSTEHRNSRRKTIRSYVARVNEPRLETAQHLVGSVGTDTWVDLERTRVMWRAFTTIVTKLTPSHEALAGGARRSTEGRPLRTEPVAQPGPTAGDAIDGSARGSATALGQVSENSEGSVVSSVPASNVAEHVRAASPEGPTSESAATARPSMTPDEEIAAEFERRVRWDHLQAKERTNARIDIVRELERPWTMPLVVMNADLGAYGELTRALVDSSSPGREGARDNEDALRWFQQAFMTLATRVIHRNHGIIAKFAGDGVLALFGVDEAIATRWRMRSLEEIGFVSPQVDEDYRRFGSVRIAPLRALLAAQELTQEYEKLRARLHRVMDEMLPGVRHRPREGLRVGLTLGWCLAGIFDAAFGDISPVEAKEGGQSSASPPLYSNAMIDLFGRSVNVAARSIELSRSMFWRPRDAEPVSDSRRVIRSSDIVVDHCFKLRCERLMSEHEPFVKVKFSELVPNECFNLKHDDTCTDFYRAEPSISAPAGKNRNAYSLWHADWMGDAAHNVDLAMAELENLERNPEWRVQKDREGVGAFQQRVASHCPSWLRLGMFPMLWSYLMQLNALPEDIRRPPCVILRHALRKYLRNWLSTRHTKTSVSE